MQLALSRASLWPRQGAGALLGSCLGGVDVALAQDILGNEVGVAAQQDVRATAGHVGGDGDGALAASLGHDLRLALVELGVEHVVLDAALVQDAGEALGVLDGDGAHQAGLAVGVADGDVLGHGVELGLDGAVDQVVVVNADDGLVGRNDLNGDG